jgi:hypothetical protein
MDVWTSFLLRVMVPSKARFFISLCQPRELFARRARAISGSGFLPPGFFSG